MLPPVDSNESRLMIQVSSYDTVYHSDGDGDGDVGGRGLRSGEAGSWLQSSRD